MNRSATTTANTVTTNAPDVRSWNGRIMSAVKRMKIASVRLPRRSAGSN